MPYECPFSMQQNSYHFAVDYKVDLLGITETWLHMEGSDMAIGELCPNGYRLRHTPRLTGRGGGVGLLYKQGISFKSKQGFVSILLHHLNAWMSPLLLVRV